MQIYFEIDHGSSLTALFPAADGSPAEAAPEEPTQLVSGTETVLVVENEKAIRDVTNRILRRNGYQVLVAPNGPEAIELVRRHRGRIDLLLTDVVMPKMLGSRSPSGCGQCGLVSGWCSCRVTPSRRCRTRASSIPASCWSRSRSPM